VLEWLRDKTAAGRFGSKNIAVVLSAVLLSFFLLSCGGSGDGGDETTETVVFAPVVFMADNDTPGVIELYASFDDGTNIVKLSGTLVAGGNVVDFRVSSDGIWVAYVADQDTNDVFELYVVPVDKTDSDDPVKISGDPMAGDGIKEKASGRYAFQWAPDTSRVAYLADQTTAGVVELYSNTPDGNSGTTIRLSVLFGTNRDVEDFAWSPDLDNHRRIAYLADEQIVDVIELYTTEPDNSFSIKINDGLGPGRNVTDFEWAPDASRIAFIADKVVGVFELYTTFPTTTIDVLVSGSLAVTSDVLNFKWSPDSARLAYLVLSATPDFQLLTTLNSVLASTSISSDIEDGEKSNYGWSWDSSLIAFIADEDFVDQFELYTSDPVDVSTKTQVSGNPVSGGDVKAFKWAPTELLIAYTADQDTNNKIELYTTNPPPSIEVEKVSGTPFAGDTVEDDFKWSPDSSLIAYRADQDTLNQIELYSVEPDGSDNDKVSGTLPSGGDVDEFKWDDLGIALGYLANQISVTVNELFASLPNGAENTRLSSNLVDSNGNPEADGNVSAFEWVP